MGRLIPAGTGLPSLQAPRHRGRDAGGRGRGGGGSARRGGRGLGRCWRSSLFEEGKRWVRSLLGPGPFRFEGPVSSNKTGARRRLPQSLGPPLKQRNPSSPYPPPGAGSRLDLAQFREVTCRPEMGSPKVAGHGTPTSTVRSGVVRDCPQRVVQSLGSTRAFLGSLTGLVHNSKLTYGLPKTVFDDIRAGVRNNRAQFFRDLSLPFYGYNKPDAKASEGVRDSFWRQGMQSSIIASYDCIEAFSETDFTEDLKQMEVRDIDSARGCRPDCSDRGCFVPLREAGQEFSAEGHPGCAPRPLHHACGPGKRRTTCILEDLVCFRKERMCSDGSAPMGMPH